MGTLRQDIKEQSIWIVKAFKVDNFELDYSIDSLIEIDLFFKKHTMNGKATPNGRLTKNLGPILFSIASYIGEVIIKTIPGTIWITDDKDPDGELNVTLQLPNGTLIFPTQRVMKRFKNGLEDSIYVYGHSIISEVTDQPFNKNFWELMQNRPWWKVW